MDKCKDCFGAANNDCEQCDQEETAKVKTREKTKLYEAFMNCCQTQSMLRLKTKDNESVVVDCRNPDHIILGKNDQDNISGSGNDIWNLLCDMNVIVDW